jgi:hypothetical protein
MSIDYLVLVPFALNSGQPFALDDLAKPAWRHIEKLADGFGPHESHLLNSGLGWKSGNASPYSRQR